MPDPESNSNFESLMLRRMEQELRFNEGTHVPEPRIVTVMSLEAVSKRPLLSDIRVRLKF